MSLTNPAASSNLFIPRKNTPTAGEHQPDYETDMRAIEMWANRQKPGDTVGGFQISIGGIGTGQVAAWGAGNVGFTGTTTPQTTFTIAGGTPGYPPSMTVSGTTVLAVLGSGGFLYCPAAGTQIIFGNVIFDAPQFTGPSPTVGAIVYLSVVEANGVTPAVNALHVASRQINIASGGNHLLLAADYSVATIVGADLTFTGGVTRTTAGNYPLIAAWSLSVIWDTANTYTSG
jgi:hypothetical protein